MKFNLLAIFEQLMQLWLPFVRIMAFIQFSPMLDYRTWPISSKLILSLLLAFLIAPMLQAPTLANQLATSPKMLLLICEQILWGFIFGNMLNMIFTAIQTAGHILSFNMGLGMAVMNDPANGSSTSVISQFTFVFTGLLFFIMDTHLLFISILYKGFTYWPIGQALSVNSLQTFIFNLGWVISSALLLALPTSFIMLVVQGGFGFLNRISPTLNLYSLGFPISMLFGLSCLGLMITFIPNHYIELTNVVLAKFDSLWSIYG